MVKLGKHAAAVLLFTSVLAFISVVAHGSEENGNKDDHDAISLVHKQASGNDAAKPPFWMGLAAVFVASLGFGSNFVPVKKFETGDGMFFQWILCSAVWVVGIAIYCARGFPTFQPVAMFGGVLWATGNVLCVPVIKLVGLGLGLLIWGQTNMLVGWASSRFGILGVKSQADQIAHPSLNYAGVGLAILALSLYVFIGRPEEDTESAGEADVESIDMQEDVEHAKSLKQKLLQRDKKRLVQHAAGQNYAGYHSTPRLLGNETYRNVDEVGVASKVTLLDEAAHTVAGAETADAVMSNIASDAGSVVYQSKPRSVTPKESSNPIDRLSRDSKRSLGIALAVISGVFYGTNFNPPQHIMDYGTDCHPLADNTTFDINRPGCADPNGLDYVFPHFCGIYLASTFYFLLYCAVMKNKPRIYPQAILPGFASGIIWATAQSSWFVANAALGMPLAFPLINSGPGLIAALWGVFVFKEISGRRDLMILGMAFCMTISSGVCIGLSH